VINSGAVIANDKNWIFVKHVEYILFKSSGTTPEWGTATDRWRRNGAHSRAKVLEDVISAGSAVNEISPRWTMTAPPDGGAGYFVYRLLVANELTNADCPLSRLDSLLSSTTLGPWTRHRASLRVLLDYEFQTVTITFDDTKLEDRDRPPGCARRLPLRYCK
jgi:hypothetical protein